MQTSTPSATATSETPLQRLIRSLDPERPSIIVPPAAFGIADASQVYGAEGRNKPGFVLADDANFEGGQ